jgi:hypothetical protein
MAVPDRFRFPAMLVLLFTVTFGVVLFLRQPERTPAAGLASIPITPQISPR